MREWVRYFVGTPQRAMRTFIAITVIAVVIFPAILRVMAERFIAELGPLFARAATTASQIIGPLVTLIVLLAALYILILPLLRKLK